MIKCKKHKAEVIDDESWPNNSYLLSDNEEAQVVQVSDAHVINETDKLTSDPDTIASKESEQEILIFLLSLMALSGLLAIISNGMVILADVKSRNSSCVDRKFCFELSLFQFIEYNSVLLNFWISFRKWL